MSKKKKSKKDKKPGKGTGSTLKALAQNPLVADVVAAALVATAAALKDSKRARALASDAGEELARLSKKSAKAGDALWEMALQIGRRSLDALSGTESGETAKTKSAGSKGSSKKRSSTAKPK